MALVLSHLFPKSVRHFLHMHGFVGQHIIVRLISQQNHL